MRQEILEIPRALRLMWVKGQPLYEAVVRRAAWQESPIFITGSGASYWAALTAAYAFESFLKLPAVARSPEVLDAYTSPALRVRTLLIAISPSGECEKTLEAAQAAKKRGAVVWGVTAEPASRLAALADGVVPVYLHEAPLEGMQSAFCHHAVVLLLALAAARILKGRWAGLEAQEAELEKLPENIERVHSQFTDAARALAGEFRSVAKVIVTGGGMYYPIAGQAAHHLRKLAGLPSAGVDALQLRELAPPPLDKDTGILVLSGSRCRLKGEVGRMAADLGSKLGGKLFAVTDGNDHQLSGKAAASVLLPTLLEPIGALLALDFLDCVIHYAAAHSSKAPAPDR